MSFKQITHFYLKEGDKSMFCSDSFSSMRTISTLCSFLATAVNKAKYFRREGDK